MKKKKKIPTLEIKHCSECPFLEKKRFYSSDSWELAYDWHCKKENDKVIESYVGWNEEDDVKIPDWCPILK